MTDEKSIAKTTTYKALVGTPDVVAGKISSIIHDMGLRYADIPRIKVPAGGGTAIEIPNVREGSDVTKEITGVIVAVRRGRRYWSSEIGDTGGPPDCRSDDMETGIGTPGGACANCRLNEFGSKDRHDGKESKAKACIELMDIVIVRSSGVLPVIMQVPPSSIKPMRSYLLGLLSEEISPLQCQTQFTLTSTQSAEGKPYAQWRAAFAGLLDEHTAKSASAYSEVLKKLPSWS